MKRRLGLLTALAAFSAFVALGGTASAIPIDFRTPDDNGAPDESGAVEFRNFQLGNFLTECPQAGIKHEPRPLDRRQKDDVERASEKSGNIRLNQDYSCFPQDETSLSINPLNEHNVVGGANDYRLGFGSSGFYATTNGGHDWYDGILPAPSVGGAVSPGGYLPSSGDPAVVYDRDGVVYYAQLAFLPNNDTNGVFVGRSTNGGFTWSRPRVGGSNAQSPPTPCPGTPCAIANDPRQPGDGVVDFIQDNDALVNSSVSFDDKEYISAGPRPAGVTPKCFTPAHAVTPCATGAPIGSDRLYVTWTQFNFVQVTCPTGVTPPCFAQTSSQINVSYSDDEGRSWAAKQVISGSAAFCTGSFAGGSECDDNQGSSPTVNPVTGELFVGFINGDTPDEDQYLLVRSTDGGQTFQGPFQVTPLYDINYPRACSPGGGGCTRPDCAPRNAQRRSTLTNSCFRVNSYANIVADRRGGAFADDLYAIVDDNRNGNPASTNVDVFFFRSTDGGQTWIGPTRVNNDGSVPAPNRDCGRVEGATPSGDVNTPCNGVGDFGNDQFFPWVDVNAKGDVAITFMDRRLDTDSTRSEWPISRQRPGNYLTWYWGAACRIKNTATVPTTGTAVPDALSECAANEAQVTRQPTAPVNPGPNPVPGQSQAGLPFRNFQISDVPSNLDYAFPRGVFIGDYNNTAIPDFGGDKGGDTVWADWTDARNGRSSGGQGGDTVAPSEPGRNPLCEQSDIFADTFNINKHDEGKKAKGVKDADAFLVALCPPAAQDKESVKK